MTMQQAPERRPKAIDLNLLPTEYQPPKKSHLGPVLYLIVFILACALAVVIVVKSGVDSDINSLNQTSSNLQQQLTELQDNKAEADPIKDQIAVAQTALENIQTDYETYVGGRTLWSEIISEIDNLIPGQKITLKSITPSETGVVIDGVATKRTYVYDYAVDLEESDYFEKAVFTFGDCPDTSVCDFDITVTLTTAN